MPSASPGHPIFVPLVTINHDEYVLSERIVFHGENIKSILLSDKVANKKVVIIGITGAAYTGKSYLLNMMMAYLKLQDLKVLNEITFLSGFDWGRDPTKRTNGINIYNGTFIVKLTKPNEEVAVLFMDSQGLYDSLKQSSMEDDTVIYTLLQLFSSNLFFNVSRQINELDMSYLTLLCDYANRTQSEIDKTTSYKECLFQQISIIIRDWSYLDQHQLGHKGGQDYIQELISISPAMPKDHKLKRNLFKSLYEKIDGFLFPYPGKEVARKNEFNGQWTALDEDFQEMFKQFFKAFLDPDKLQLKKIFGTSIKCCQLVRYTEDYYHAAVASDRPNIFDAIDANSHNNHLQLQYTCLQYYDDLMKRRFEYTESAECYFNYHLECQSKAIEKFINTPKYGSQNLTQKSIKQLKAEISTDFQYLYYFVPNKNVNIRHVLTKIVYFVVIIFILSVGRKIFQYIKNEKLVLISDLINMLLMACLILYIARQLNHWFSSRNEINDGIQALIINQIVTVT